MDKYNEPVLFGEYLCTEDVKHEFKRINIDISHMTDEEINEQVEDIGKSYCNWNNDGLAVLIDLFEIKPKKEKQNAHDN